MPPRVRLTANKARPSEVSPKHEAAGLHPSCSVPLPIDERTVAQGPPSRGESWNGRASGLAPCPCRGLRLQDDPAECGGSRPRQRAPPPHGPKGATRNRQSRHLEQALATKSAHASRDSHPERVVNHLGTLPGSVKAMVMTSWHDAPPPVRHPYSDDGERVQDDHGDTGHREPHDC